MSHKIKLFYIDDNSLKQLGELLSNETSRSIIKALIEKEHYTNELAEKLGIQVSLVIHHLKKLEELNLVNVTKKRIVKKGVERRFFRIKSDIFITKTTKEGDSKIEGFKKIFNDGIKFVAIGIVSALSYITTKYYESTEKVVSHDSGGGIEYIPVIEYPIIIALAVIILGLAIDRIILFKKNKRRG